MPAAPVVRPAPITSAVPQPGQHSPVPQDASHCPRCRGVNARNAVYCQFCGAGLGEHTPDVGPPGPTGVAVQHNSAKLVVIAQDGTPGRQYPLADEQTDIGREEGAILLPSDPYVSPRHARVFQRGGRFFVRDLASVNGVYVRIRAAERLQNADLVLIGLEVLRFEVVSDAEKGLGPATERGTRVFGSPSLPRYARLGQRTVEGATRDMFYLGRDETVIGRESGDLVFTNDPFMSRRHAIFMRDPATNTFLLQDLGSSNGTYLAIRGEHELASGDHVRIGQHLFRLDVDTGRARS
jgi:pSer/pThr/pTyr-binding forkhead associated (FHA) protein